MIYKNVYIIYFNFKNKNTFRTDDYNEFKKIISDGGFVGVVGMEMKKQKQKSNQKLMQQLDAYHLIKKKN